MPTKIGRHHLFFHLFILGFVICFFICYLVIVVSFVFFVFWICVVFDCLFRLFCFLIFSIFSELAWVWRTQALLFVACAYVCGIPRPRPMFEVSADVPWPYRAWLWAPRCHHEAWTPAALEAESMRPRNRHLLKRGKGNRMLLQNDKSIKQRQLSVPSAPQHK